MWQLSMVTVWLDPSTEPDNFFYTMFTNRNPCWGWSFLYVRFSCNHLFRSNIRNKNTIFSWFFSIYKFWNDTNHKLLINHNGGAWLIIVLTNIYKFIPYLLNRSKREDFLHFWSYAIDQKIIMLFTVKILTFAHASGMECRKDVAAPLEGLMSTWYSIPLLFCSEVYNKLILCMRFK